MPAGDWKDMFRAACDGDVELVRFHLDSGVDVDHAHPEFQSTALVASIVAGHEEIANLLLDHGADPSLASTFEERTPAQAAHEAGMTELLTRLRSAGAAEPVLAAAPATRRRGRWLRSAGSRR